MSYKTFFYSYCSSSFFKPVKFQYLFVFILLLGLGFSANAQQKSVDKAKLKMLRNTQFDNTIKKVVPSKNYIKESQSKKKEPVKAVKAKSAVRSSVKEVSVEKLQKDFDNCNKQLQLLKLKKQPTASEIKNINALEVKIQHLCKQLENEDCITN